MESKPVRRVVTGHNTSGQAIIQEDGAVPRVSRIGGVTGPLFHEVWNTQATPAPIDASSGEPSEDGISLSPPRNGTRIRVLDIPPDDASLATKTAEEARAHFAEIGAAEAASHTGAGSRHAHMHRTQTIDYGIVLEGELVLRAESDRTGHVTLRIHLHDGAPARWTVETALILEAGSLEHVAAKVRTFEAIAIHVA